MPVRYWQMNHRFLIPGCFVRVGMDLIKRLVFWMRLMIKNIQEA